MPRQKSIVAAADSNDLARYDSLAAFVKRSGFKAMSCGSMSEQTLDQRYDPNDSWLRFVMQNSAMMKVVETPLMAQVISKSHREKNAALLAAKSEILARHGLGGITGFLEPQILPASFYAARPDIRGPRCDQPCVAMNPYYAPCIDHPEVLAHYREATRKILEIAPSITTITIWTNDSGGGICWCSGLYPDPNGPESCRLIPMGLRIRKWMQAILAGAADAGRKIEVYFNPTHFSKPERYDVIDNLPPRAGLFAGARGWPNVPFEPGDARENVERLHRAGRKALIGLDPTASYPLLPVIEPPLVYFILDRIREIAGLGLDVTSMGGISPSTGGTETVTTAAALSGAMRAPKSWTDIERRAARIARDHVGGALGGVLLSAWRDVDMAFRVWPNNADTNHMLYPYYSILADRWLTRPLVPAPQVLTDAERAYYMKGRHLSANRADVDSFFINEGEKNYETAEFKWALAMYDEMMLYMDRAVAALRDGAQEALTVAPEFRERFILQRGRIEMLRAVWRTQRNVLRCGSTIEFFTGDKKEQYLHGVRRDESFLEPGTYRRLFLEAMDDEIENCREMTRLMAESPAPLIATGEPESSFVLSSKLADQFAEKIAVMERHKGDIDILFPNCPPETFADPTYGWADEKFRGKKTK